MGMSIIRHHQSHLLQKKLLLQKQRLMKRKKPPMKKLSNITKIRLTKAILTGLLRMGERYRDGDGVPKDLD